MKKKSLLEQAIREEKRIKNKKLECTLREKNECWIIIKSLLPNYSPLPHQEGWHKARAREKGLKGGYGSGKTIAFCAEAIALSYLNRPYWIILSSPSEDNALMTVLPHLKKLCDDNGIEYIFTKDMGHFEIDYGDKKGNIFLIGQKFMKGPNVAAVGLDEPFSQKKETYNNLIARVREPRAKRQEIFWAGTSEPNVMEWGFNFFEKDDNTQLLYTTTCSSYLNKYLNSEVLETLERKYDAKMKEVYLMGKYVSLSGGKVYHIFDRNKHIKETDKKKLGEIIIGYDFNVDPICAVIGGIAENKIYIVEEIKIHNSDTKELTEVVIERIKDYKNERSVIITGDVSGLSRKTVSASNDYMIIKECFRGAGIKYMIYLEESNPAVRDRTNLVNKMFESGKLYISAGCVESIKDFELVIWKQGGQGFHIDKSKKELTHLSDATGYLCWIMQRVIMNDYNEGERNYCYKRGARRREKR
ncbi:MAG: hypothetical protein FJ216_10740 [Ignavibacteria bacterium]|nr:hypothetical protein [Ignavibacteria bacterium]